MPKIDSETLIAIEKGKDAVEEALEARARLIYKMSLKTLSPLHDGDWDGRNKYQLEDYESWETYNEQIHVQFESRACGRGCCGMEGECLEIPFSVWNEPTQENVDNWRNPIGEKKQAKKRAEEEKKNSDRKKREKETYLSLKEKYGDE